MRKPEDNEKFEKLKAICQELLSTIGEDYSRDGLKETPARWARMWMEFIGPQTPVRLATSFQSVRVDQMVAVTGMRVWSLCEHHLMPFWCDVSVGYLTNKRILGLSKFARIAQHAAARLQVQERLVDDIAQAISEATDTEDVAVIAKGEHLCMLMRGVKTGATMVSSVMEGRFRVEPDLRAEFLSLAGEDRGGRGR